MTPVVMEPPSLSMPSSSLTAMASRGQQFAPTGHLRQSSASTSVTHADVVNQFSSYDAMVSPRDRNSSALQPSGDLGLSPTDVVPRASCANCGTLETPMWRRDGEGNSLCNACGE